MTKLLDTPESQRQTTPSAVAPCSASPITDDAWDAYNRRACGLHYIAHKMRNMEIALRAAADALESDCANERRKAWNLVRDTLGPNVPSEPRR